MKHSVSVSLKPFVVLCALVPVWLCMCSGLLHSQMFSLEVLYSLQMSSLSLPLYLLAFPSDWNSLFASLPSDLPSTITLSCHPVYVLPGSHYHLELLSLVICSFPSILVSLYISFLLLLKQISAEEQCSAGDLG